MSGVLFNVTTAVLMVLLLNSGLELVGRGTIGRRRVPWVALVLTALAVGGVVLQLCWHGAMAALDDDPSRSGWWRAVTSVFLQNGGVVGTAFNIVTLAVIAALAEWFWGRALTLVLFFSGMILPQYLDAFIGATSGSTDPRNFVGSSGATFFLAATLAAALLFRGRENKHRLLALSVPALGLTLWFAQANGHGLVSVYGFVLGGLVWLVGHRLLRLDADLYRAPRMTMAALIGAVGRRRPRDRDDDRGTGWRRNARLASSTPR